VVQGPQEEEDVAPKDVDRVATGLMITCLQLIEVYLVYQVHQSRHTQVFDDVLLPEMFRSRSDASVASKEFYDTDLLLDRGTVLDELGEYHLEG
jgi:hypothetical protein